jgi:hypothetical protein
MKKSKAKSKKDVEPEVLSALETRNYLETKFDMTDDAFWSWFFSETEFGEINLLSCHPDNIDFIPKNSLNYFKCLRDEFQADFNEDDCLEIENDL